MKRIILVLVLLVTWSLASVPSLTNPAQAGEIQVPEDSKAGPGCGDTAESTGEPDDDSEGDPGDAGDGYGAAGDPRVRMEFQDGSMSEGSAMEEYIIFLLLMVQQLAP